MTYEQLKHLKASAFKRRCGIHEEIFAQMVEVLRPQLDRQGKRGGQCKLSALRPAAASARILAGISNAVSYCYQLGFERISCVSINSSGRKAVDGLRQVSFTWQEAAIPKMLTLGACWWWMSQKALPSAQKKTARLL